MWQKSYFGILWIVVVLLVSFLFSYLLASSLMVVSYFEGIIGELADGPIPLITFILFWVVIIDAFRIRRKGVSINPYQEVAIIAIFPFVTYLLLFVGLIMFGSNPDDSFAEIFNTLAFVGLYPLPIALYLRKRKGIFDLTERLTHYSRVPDGIWIFLSVISFFIISFSFIFSRLLTGYW
jgi:hypothetical protein